MATVIVPIGFDTGVDHPADANEALRYHVIRGRDSVSMSAAEYRVWAMAFADVDAHQNLSLTRDRLAYLCSDTTGDGVAKCRRLVDQLVDEELLAEYDPDGDSALDFLKRHRLTPTAHGMGNTADEPTTYAIGRGGQKIIELFYANYLIWATNSSYSSLWDTIWSISGTGDDEIPTADHIGHTFARILPTLISLDLAHLQPT